jgi:hypothetical protein
MRRSDLHVLGVMACVLSGVVAFAGQPPPEKPAPVEKLGPTSYRIGKLHVDTAKREVTAPGTVNPLSTLEFVANTPQGVKAYESAFTLDTGAISFNAALLLIGLDPARAKPPQMQFDPTAPVGDPVDIEVEWTAGGKTRRAKIHELLFDTESKKTLAPGPWVYTGSTFVDYGSETGRRYLAESDGVLIGLMHGPQPIIENPRNDALGRYGAITLNPEMGLTENMPVTLTVRALPLGGKPKR